MILILLVQFVDDKMDIRPVKKTLLHLSPNGLFLDCLQCFDLDTVGCVSGRASGVVVCLERCANDLHMVQLMQLPPHHLLRHQNPEWFNLSGVGLPRLCWKNGR